MNTEPPMPGMPVWAASETLRLVRAHSASKAATRWPMRRATPFVAEQAEPIGHSAQLAEQAHALEQLAHEGGARARRTG